jgi:transcription initiation factor TFIID subunit 5
MSSISFELFIHYLQDNKYMNLLRIVNRHFSIHIVTGKLTPASAGGSSEEGIIGHPNNQIEEFHEINNVHLEQDEDTDMEVKKEQIIETVNLDDMASIT